MPNDLTEPPDGLTGPKFKFETWVRKAMRLAMDYRTAGGYAGSLAQAKFKLEEHLRKCPGRDPDSAGAEDYFSGWLDGGDPVC